MIRLFSKLWEFILARRRPEQFARALGVKLGSDCRLISVSRRTFGSEPYLVTLGDHVTVTSGVTFVTHDGGVWVFRHEDPDIELVAPITVGSNVFIGINSVILPGVTVGDDVVIGASSVVTKDIPAGSVVAGNPARRICSVESYRQKTESRLDRMRGLERHDREAYLRKRFGVPD